MTVDEAEREFHSLDRYFCTCRETGQGINSKEGVRFRAAARVLVDNGRGDRLSMYYDRTAQEKIEDWDFAQHANKVIAQSGIPAEQWRAFFAPKV